MADGNASRLDASYFKRRHRLRLAQLFASAGLLGLAVLWVGGASLFGRRTIYANGPISTSHRFIEAECEHCHTEGFGPIYDAACGQCHAVAEHVPVGPGKDPACGACHAEHRGDALLGAIDDRHCNACHEDHSSITSLETHIWFKPPPRDQKIHFNHVLHGAPELVGGPLECNACHVPAGRDFGPVRFAQHCARCHNERVGDLVDQMVPHGFQYEDLGDWITAVYLRRWKATRGFAEPSSVPGQSATEIPPWAVALRERALRALNALFEPGRGCLICHVGDRDGIETPRIPAHWFPRARFDHKTHRLESCDRCHDLRENTTAAALSLPKVETCRACHRRRSARSSCVTCHPFHPPHGPSPAPADGSRGDR
ncbi:MAG: hypothetical protein ACYTEZ_03635 [Planctomycetota bacterium]|jgi:hypothetical protein